MKNSEIINKIKLMLGIEVQLESLLLDNGTQIEAEVFEAGQEVFILTQAEEGAEVEKVPVPQGEYILEDGRSLVVNAEGLIESIGEAQEEAEEEETPEAEEEQEMESEKPAPANPKKVVSSITEEVHFQALAEKDEEIKKLKAQIVELSKEDEAEEEAEESEEGSEVEMEAEETEDIKPNPEAEVEKKVNFSKEVLKPQTKRDRIYNALFG